MATTDEDLYTIGKALIQQGINLVMLSEQMRARRFSAMDAPPPPPEIAAEADA